VNGATTLHLGRLHRSLDWLAVNEPEIDDLAELAGFLDRLRSHKREVTDLEQIIEQRLADAMTSKVVNIDDHVVLERHTGAKRTHWDWDGLLRKLGVDRWVDAVSGEYVADTLKAVVSLTASVSPRAGALRDRGIDPDEYSESKPGRVSVQVATREDQ